MPDAWTVNDTEYTVLRLLGKGKGGYSYLVTDGGAQYVLKQIHHEPCDYYTFGDKLQSELRDYETLRNARHPHAAAAGGGYPAGAHLEGVHRRTDGRGAPQSGTAGRPAGLRRCTPCAACCTRPD